MSGTLRKAIGEMKAHQRQLAAHQRHLEAVAKKIDVLRKKGASKKGKKAKR